MIRAETHGRCGITCIALKFSLETVVVCAIRFRYQHRLNICIYSVSIATD